MSRLVYFAKRLLLAAITLLGVAVLLFILLRMMPGDPASAILGIAATPDQIDALRAKLGLDQPLFVQLGAYLASLAQLDLGTSFIYKKPVVEVIAPALPITLQLACYVAVLSVLVTVVLSSIAAVRRGGVVDNLIRAIPLVGIGMPAFWIGTVLMFLFALTIKVFPLGGYQPGFPGALVSLFLPALTITISISAVLVRSLRAGLVQVLDSDHVMTARAKGVSGLRLMVGHVLPNAAVPTLTILGLVFAGLVGGTLVVEQVFGIPGVGTLVINAFRAQDFALVSGVVVFAAAIVLIVNILIDIVISFIDPRVVLR